MELKGDNYSLPFQIAEFIEEITVLSLAYILKKNHIILRTSLNTKILKILLKNLNVNVAYQDNHTIRNMQMKNSPDKTKGNRCDQFHIGRAGKILENSIKQHKISVR